MLPGSIKGLAKWTGGHPALETQAKIALQEKKEKKKETNVEKKTVKAAFSLISKV